MEKKGIREGLRKRVAEIIRETKSKLGVKKNSRFDILISDLEEMKRK